MCRLVGYVGPEPVSAHELMVTPASSLYRQSFAPRMQTYGRMNADGFGVGWYDPAVRAEPARYRRAVPIWTDLSFASFAPMVSSRVMLAAVRCATPPFPIEETGSAPFTHGQWLFAHNGSVDNYTTGVGQVLRRSLSDERAQLVLGAADSEVLFAMILDRIDDGADPADACVATIGRVKELTGGRFNFVLTDGHRMIATRYGDTLFTVADRLHAGSTVIASEPFDDGDGWNEVPDLSVVDVRDGRIEMRSL